MSIGYSSNSRSNGFTSGGIGPSQSVAGVTIPITFGGAIVLGGGIRGFMAPPTNDVDKSYADYEQTRFTLRQGWNTKYPSELKAANRKRIITPFRAVTNSGDLLARKYYSCGGPCQSFQSRPGMFGLTQRFGAIYSQCDGTGVPAASCNTKFVYDSSDYVTYLKQKAVNKNYNDLSNGGNQSSGSQVAFRAVRRY